MIMTTDSRVRITDTVIEDVYPVAQNMRQTDRDEIKASHGFEPLDALIAGVERSTICKTVWFNLVPIAVYGIVPTEDSNLACIWFLGADTLDQIHLCFGHMSKKIIESFLDVYPYLYNFVDSRNTKSIGWLKWCGAEISEPEPFGVSGINFQHFIFRRKEHRSCAALKSSSRSR